MNQSSLNTSETECRQVFLSSALAIVMITGLSFLLAFIISHLLPSSSPSDIPEFTALAASAILPEPTERRTFQIMVLLLPLLALLSYVTVRKFSHLFFSSSEFVRLGYVSISLLMIIWVNSWAFWPNYMLSSGLGSFSIVFPVITGLLLLLYTYGHIAPFQWMDALIKKRFALAFTLVTGVCFFIAISYRIFDWKLTLKHPIVLHHLNPILYYTSLAETGNFSTYLGAPQYGFYSFYLKPVFNLLGLTIYSFSLVMTLLYLLGVVAIAVPFLSLMKSPYLKLLFIPVLCALQGSLRQASLNWEPYFQYYPIRFLVPALSVLMLHLVLRTRKESARVCLAALSSFLLGFLVFWNFDSCIVTVIAWLGFFLLLATIETIRRRALNLACSLFFSVLPMLALGILLASILLISCDNTGFSFGRLFDMQKIYYMKGFYMLPMPLLPHPWMAVIGVYVAVLVLALPLTYHTGLRCSPKRMLVLYVAIIGIGLFSYYQGRSHNEVLPSVTWPAIACCFLACDWCMSTDFAKQQSAIRFLVMPFMLLVVSLTVKLAFNSPWYLDRLILLHKELTLSDAKTRTMSAPYVFNWLSEYQNEPPGSVLIIHPAESLLYVESGLHPLPMLPSEQERFFFRWQETYMQRLIQPRTIRHIFISPCLPKTPEYEKLIETIRSHYKFEKAFWLEHWISKEQFSK